MAQGQGSGDFRETSGRVQIFHVVTRNSYGVLSADSFTQNNPPIVASTHTSTTLSGITKKGVLGASVAFSRYDAGNGFHGGPVQISAANDVLIRPLGIFINDAVGNAFENTPGVASNRGPYLCGSGTTIGVTLWESQVQVASSNAVTYNVGDKLYASINGFLTNVVGDAYENSGGLTNTSPTLIGILKVVPDANNSLMVLDLRV
jgi:hypothetical protein